MRRSARILELLAAHGMGQTILTVPRETDIPPALTQLERWRIEAGVVHADHRSSDVADRGLRQGAA